MTEKGRRDFCVECRKETGYFLQKKDIVRTIRDKDYTFGITVAVCAECGGEMNIPGLIDKNIQEIDEQYREVEGLVSIEENKKPSVRSFSKSSIPMGSFASGRMML